MVWMAVFHRLVYWLVTVQHSPRLRQVSRQKLLRENSTAFSDSCPRTLACLASTLYE